MRRTLLIAALALVSATTAAAPAGATFPGRNGPIAYRVFDAVTERFPLLRALPDGTHATELTDRPGLFSDWSADGRRIAFDYWDADGNQQIATINADGSGLREITSGPGIHEVPSWSPDGHRIVFDYSPEPDPSTPGFETRLWTMRVDGSHARPLPMSVAGFDVEPKYSPDGRWIAFTRLQPAARDVDWQSAIMLVPAVGGRVRQLTPWGHTRFGELPEHPTWSPDSRWIVFDTDDRGTAADDGSIEAIRPDGRGRHTIVAASETLGFHKPWFSPDGKKILVVCGFMFPDGGFNDDLCVIDAEGSNLVNLTNAPATHENWHSWAPAPRGHSRG